MNIYYTHDVLIICSIYSIFPSIVCLTFGCLNIIPRSLWDSKGKGDSTGGYEVMESIHRSVLGRLSRLETLVIQFYRHGYILYSLVIRKECLGFTVLPYCFGLRKLLAYFFRRELAKCRLQVRSTPG